MKKTKKIAYMISGLSFILVQLVPINIVPLCHQNAKGLSCEIPHK